MAQPVKPCNLCANGYAHRHCIPCQIREQQNACVCECHNCDRADVEHAQYIQQSRGGMWR